MSERPGRVPTSTSAFGVGRRESHDATGFYARFETPELSVDDAVEPLEGLQQGGAACIVHDSRELVLPDGRPLPDNSVALVVTSPPYFSGKEYEQALGEGHVPGSYLDYLQMLRDVFAECKRVLEPGGRIAVNVANLGRKPYRSLASDVIRILQDDLRLLLRGEVVWRKGEGASGSCAWGSYRSAANPVLRDVTERVVIASKGRFDRAVPVEKRRARGLPSETGIGADEFMASTLDVWNLEPERATRVNHPAPFPVELPQRLIGLYTYRGDVVLDPFLGSGSTSVAAIRTGRRYLGYDLDPAYISLARERVEAELRDWGDALLEAPAGGVAAVARELLETAGFTGLQPDARQRGLGLAVDYAAVDAGGVPWYFLVSGGFTTTRAGLLRMDEVWQAIGRAGVLARGRRSPVVLLSSHLPRRGSEGDRALRAAGAGLVFDVVELLAHSDHARLKIYAGGGRTRPEPGFWSERELPAP